MKRLLLGIAGLAMTLQSFSQTFTESAASYGLDLQATKDGGLCFGDFNQDGILDLVVNTTDASVRSVLYFSNGIGSYSDVTDTHANALNATTKERSAVVGDFNLDGYLDFVVADFNRIEVWLNQGPSSTPAYAFGTLTQTPNQSIVNLTGGINAEGIVTVDYNNDGYLDLIVDNQSFGVDILVNDGAGTFTQVDNTTTGLPTGGVFGDYAAAGDYDNDGFVDVLFRRSADLSLYHNNGNGTFSGVTSLTANSNNSNKGSAIFCDFDNDTDLDILWSDQGTNQIWRNNGSSGWVATGLPTITGNTVPNGIDGLSAADVDNDGDMDFYMGNGNGDGYLFINTDPTNLTFVRNNLGISPGRNTEGLSFVDIDNDGDQDLYINIDSPALFGNQLWVNDLNDGNYLFVDAKWDNGTSTSMASGATAILLDCSGTPINGLKNSGAGEGHGCFGAPRIHFGITDPNATYYLRVYFPNANGTRSVVTKEIIPFELTNQSIEVLNTDASDQLSCIGTVTANDDNFSVTLGSVLNNSVASNDVESLGAALTFNLLDAGTAGANGTLVFNADGTFSFEPTTVAGTYSFTYEACNNVVCDAATVTMTVIAANTAPVALDDAFVTDEDTVLNENVALNDSDAEGDALTFNVLSTTTNGALALQPDGSFTYTPDLNFNGIDVFTYEVCDAEFCTPAQAEILVNAVNDDVVGVADSYSGDEGLDITDNVLSNDIDIDGDVLFVGAAVNPTHGTLSIDLDGTFTYTPDAGYFGNDSFTYDACDGFGPCASVVVSIVINAVNSAPVITPNIFTVNEDAVLNTDLNPFVVDADADPLTFNLVTSTQNGTIAVNTDGTFTYTPSANYNGPDQFVFEVCDGTVCVSGTMDIDVLPMPDNTAPVTTNDSFTTDEDTALSGDVSAGDSDAEGDVLAFQLVSTTTIGTLVLNADGTFDYTPNLNFNGVDIFTYEACDAEFCTPAQVEITVNAVNDNVVAVDDNYNTTSGVDVADNVLTNDSDIDGDVIFVGTNTDPANGTLIIANDGSFTYTPNSSFSGTDSFTYEVCDGFGPCALATVTIVVINTNTAPVATNDSFSTDEDTTLSGDVSAGDSDAEGDVLAFQLVSTTTNGTLVLNADGTFDYTPNLNFNGVDIFTYEACDAEFCTPAQVEITVNAVNDNVVAVDDNYNTTLGVDVADNVLTNDSDVDGDVIFVGVNTDPSNGTLVIAIDGSFTYTPNNSFSGTDSFTYEACDGFGPCALATVTIVVINTNTAPVATNDSFSTDEDTALIGDVSAGDSDAEGDVLAFQLVSTTTNGTLVLNADGTFNYTPNLNFNGVDIFTYEACDAEFCTPAQVEITVNAVNDNVVAVDDNYNTTLGVDVADNVLTNDSDVDGDVIFVGVNTDPSNGTLVIAIDGSFTYTPNNSFSGTDSFTYEACDGFGPCALATVTIIVTNTNNAPVAEDDNFTTDEDSILSETVATNDSDADGDALTWNLLSATNFGVLNFNNDGTFLYEPNADFYGTDSFTYEVCDAFGCVSASATIDVLPVNDAPVAVDDTYSINLGDVLTDNVLVNDTDIDADVLSVGSNTQASNGSVSMDADGTFTYIPNTGFSGSDSFTYEACDGVAPCVTATVFINVDFVNNAPIANDDDFSVNEDQFIVADVSTNDSDANGDVLTYNVLTTPINGDLAWNNNGVFVYSPFGDFNGTDSFVYEACDGTSCSQAIVNITVVPVNDAPMAGNDDFTTNKNVPLFDLVNLNDIDVDGEALVYNLTSGTSNGTLVFNVDGTFAYTPGFDFVGFDSFEYEVCDGGPLCSSAVVTIQVVDNNQVPLVEDDSFVLNEDELFSGEVSANDIDPEGVPLTFSLVTSPTSGTLEFNADGTFNYTPNADYFGTDFFVYTACDDIQCASAGVTLDIQPVQDTPVGQDDNYTTGLEQPITANALDNDTDADGDVLTVVDNTAPTNGSVSMDADGTFTYIPNPGFVGTDSFVYQVCDGFTICQSATVYINVVDVNAAPTPEDDFFVMNEDGVLNENVSTNDTDPNGDVLTYSLIESPISGNVVFNADGTFTYTPNADFNGTDYFVYSVCDAEFCELAGVTISVEPLNDAPVGVDDNYTTVVDQPITENVLVNDSDVDGDILFVSGNTNPTNGIVSVDTDGTFTYIPNPGFIGSDSFTYEVCDGVNPCQTITVTINVTGENTAPIAEDDFFTLYEDLQISTSVALNDSDPENNSLTFNLLATASNGTLTFNADGSFTYIPNPNFYGIDTFEYEACDAEFCTAAGVTLEVLPLNDAPIAVEDFYFSDGTPVTENVVVNDIDADDETLVVTANTDASHGIVSVDTDGTFTYIPDPGFNGEDTFTYTVCDSQGECSTTTVYINVQIANQPPIAIDDYYTLNEDTSISANVVLNDIDPEGLELLAALLDSTNRGTVSFDIHGDFTYTPNPNYRGQDTLIYQVCDAFGLCDTAIAVFTVLPLYDAVVAVDDNYTINEDAVLNANVRGNDFNPDGGILLYTVVDNVTNGTLVLSVNGNIVYTPNPEWSGVDSFSYRVCDATGYCDVAVVTITVRIVNDRPVAVDDTFTVDEDATLNGTVATNDSDVDSPVLTFNVASNASNGTVVMNADGTFVYTPNPNFNGTDSFTYNVCDEASCDVGTVNIVVNPMYDAAVAVNDEYVMNEDGVLADNVGNNDSNIDGGPLTFTLITDVSNGTLVLNGDGTFVYTPDANYNGGDEFVYQMCDAAGTCSTAGVVITILPINDAPIADNDAYEVQEDNILNADVSVNDSDVDGDALVFSIVTNPTNGTVVLNADGTLTYTPNANFSGSDSFVYQACDPSGACDDAIVTIGVTPVNDAPIANDDTYTVLINDVLTADVSTNDVDVDGDALTYTLLGDVTNGVLVFNADGSFTYTPNADYVGSDVFTYLACDPIGLCDDATVFIDVILPNVPPVAVDDNFTTDEDTQLDASVATNDTDADDTVLTYTVQTTTTNGVLVLNADGTFTYVPNTNFNGTDSFTYLVCDPSGACDEALVTITVVPVNDVPVATDDTYFVTEDFVLNGNVLDNDSDIEGDVLTVTLVTDVTNGTLVLNADGTFTYTPNANFNGTDTFVYEACDSNGACDQALVTITVTPVDDAPFAVDDTYVTFVNVPVSGNVGDNDTDPEGGVLTFSVVSVTTNGAWILNADGTFTYTPNPGFGGVDTGVYQVCDEQGNCDQATVTFNVTGGVICTDDSFTLQEDNNLNGSVASNDTPDLTYSIINTVTSGTLVFNADGTFTYTPDPDFNGTVTFDYEGCDGAGVCDQATVTIVVTPVNDGPVDGDEAATICQETTLNIDVMANATDIDSQTLSVTSVVASVGVASYVGNGIISYVAPAGFAGTAIIGYQVCDDAAVVVCDPSEIVVTIVPNTLTVSEVVENASCFGRNDASIALTATGGLGPITFSWSTGDNTADVSELTAGDYSVVVTDAGGCAAAQTLNYTVTSPAEIVLNLNLDFDPCIDKTANIDLTVTGGVPAYIYIWADGAVSTEDRVGVEPGKTYSVTVGDAQGCTVTGEIAIDDSQADCFRVPDGFSPDGDGTNDNLVIRGIGKYPGNIVKIFNRWGNLVYEATNYDNSWNGVANTGGVVVGERVQPGTYFYVIDLNNDDEPVSGYIIIKY